MNPPFFAKIPHKSSLCGQGWSLPEWSPCNTAIKYKTKMEESDSDTLEINYGHKMFYYGGP